MNLKYINRKKKQASNLIKNLNMHEIYLIYRVISLWVYLPLYINISTMDMDMERGRDKDIFIMSFRF